MTIKIYHNPKCGTSRTVLGQIRDAGHEPEIIEYLVTPPTREEMKSLLKGMGMTPREILRRSGTPYDELNLDNEKLTDEDLLDAIGEHPILMQRPIVVSPKGTKLCRPADLVQDLLAD